MKRSDLWFIISAVYTSQAINGVLALILGAIALLIQLYFHFTDR